ncbi:MC/SLC25 family protein [Candidatus Chromulinivorax destructor]|uniref:Mitochondrial carrier protein n=1 Tax=Candidatus Chromulinivorax destructor TaxID=2066483 RepID=A0A345ZAP6_9BACT|nr:MC/SLC25 family protein [Candidatus Chromulinivorax destructor]AXK60363.1 hypothetical protein C0J27_01180 [Candidatus Chromulinivorax destructor]
MNKNVQFFAIFCMVTICIQSAEDRRLQLSENIGISVMADALPSENSHEDQSSEKRPLSLSESIVIGGVVGCLEVAFPGQILVYAMNQKIDKKPFVLSNSYKGFSAHAGGQMPITAMQKVVQVKGSDLLEKWQDRPLSIKQKIAISCCAGIAGAIIDTPCNAVQLFLQKEANAGKNIGDACKELSMKSCFKGFTANALLKEAPFAIAYQTSAPQAIEIAKEYVGDNLFAQAIGGSIVGVATAVGTQPGAVIRNRMSNDPHGVLYTSTLQTVQKIYKEEGAQAFFRGLSARGPRVGIAIPLYVMYGTAMEYIIRKEL